MAKLNVVRVRVNGSKLEIYDERELNVYHSNDPILVVIALDRDNDSKFAKFEPVGSGLAYFSWQQPGPPPGVFTVPVRSLDGKRIVIDDGHLDNATDSPALGWEYALRAYDTRDSKVKYQTDNARQALALGDDRTPTTPVIINK
jgi:hypothetical protein